VKLYFIVGVGMVIFCYALVSQLLSLRFVEFALLGAAIAWGLPPSGSSAGTPVLTQELDLTLQ